MGKLENNKNLCSCGCEELFVPPINDHDLKAMVCWCGSTHSWEKAKR